MNLFIKAKRSLVKMKNKRELQEKIIEKYGNVQMKWQGCYKWAHTYLGNQKGNEIKLVTPSTVSVNYPTKFKPKMTLKELIEKAVCFVYLNGEEIFNVFDQKYKKKFKKEL